MDLIGNNPITALIVTEVVNVLFHSFGSASSVFFTFAGTLVNTVMIFGVVPICQAIGGSHFVIATHTPHVPVRNGLPRSARRARRRTEHYYQQLDVCDHCAWKCGRICWRKPRSTTRGNYCVTFRGLVRSGPPY